jgi:hypothetical protein
MENFLRIFPHHGKSYPRHGKLFPHRGSSGFLPQMAQIVADETAEDLDRMFGSWIDLPHLPHKAAGGGIH